MIECDAYSQFAISDTSFSPFRAINNARSSFILLFEMRKKRRNEIETEAIQTRKTREKKSEN